LPSGDPSASAFTGGDTELATDSKGNVYEGELWLGSDSIYISGDKGKSWNWSPISHDVLDDREWLVYNKKDNSLYGVYDGIKAIEMIRVPVGTALGSQTARFAPIERPMFLEWDDCPGLLAGPCETKPSQVPDQVNGTPVLAGLSSPGRPAVDPKSGTVSFPMPFQTKGKGIVIASTSDGGLTFKYHYVTGAGLGHFGDTGNDFPVAAVARPATSTSRGPSPRARGSACTSRPARTRGHLVEAHRGQQGRERHRDLPEHRGRRGGKRRGVVVRDAHGG
jgi:hypothetical protein